MKTIRLILSLILLVSMATISSAQQDKVVKSIIQLGQTDNQAMNHLDVLTNRFGGRPIGSNAYDNAAEWCAAQFKKWGMDVLIDQCGTLPVGFNRGAWFGRMLNDDGMVLHFATPSYTAGTKGVQRGHVLIEPRSQAEFDRMKGALKGAWVLISGTNTGWPIDWSSVGDSLRAKVVAENEEIAKKNNEIRMENRRNPDKEPVKELPLKDEPALFYKQMREAGILGIIQSSTVPIRALYDRKNVEKMTFETLPVIPDIKLDEHQYAVIEQMVKERRYFQLEFDIRNYFRMGPVKYYNVIGIIKGTKYPDEYVGMGGHLDAFDVASGGVDCGSGITPAMEAARLIMAAGGKPKRTILVCLWAGEEFGLWGSKSWVERNKEKLPRVSYYFNRDGGPLVTSSLTVPEAMYDDYVKICEPLNTINPDFPFTLTKRTDPPRPRPVNAGGTDASSFAVKGVPSAGFGETDPKGYNFNYGEIWHTERDLYNKSIPEYQEQTAVVTAVVVYGVANLDHLLSRKGLYQEDPQKDK
jgi:hypothetical protein